MNVMSTEAGSEVESTVERGARRWSEIRAARCEQADLLLHLSAEMSGPPGMREGPEMPDGERPTMYIEDLRLLTGLARAFDAGFAIETGSYTGSSAMAFRLAGCQVFSIDDCSYGLTRERGPGSHLPNRDMWKSIHFVWGRGVDKLPGLLKVIGRRRWLFFHDSDHLYQNVLDELRLARDLGACAVACHDVRDWPETGCGEAFRGFAEESGWASREHCNLGLAWPER